jgi:hypothetical protein
MKLAEMPETATDWAQVPSFETPGASGVAAARAQKAGDVQLRLVEYSSNYLADHWCSKGHILYVVAGALTIEHENGEGPVALSAGMSWRVADNSRPAHRVRSAGGATAFIID